MQKLSTWLLLDRGHLLNTSIPGSGKTLLGPLATALLHCSTLVVCPNSVVAQTAALYSQALDPEQFQVLSKLDVVKSDGHQSSRCQVLIVNKDMLQDDSRGK